MKRKHCDNLQKKCKGRENGKTKVKTEILQRIKAKAGKINRYQPRIGQFQQNRLFGNNEVHSYKWIDDSQKW